MREALNPWLWRAGEKAGAPCYYLGGGKIAWRRRQRLSARETDGMPSDVAAAGMTPIQPQPALVASQGQAGDPSGGIISENNVGVWRRVYVLCLVCNEGIKSYSVRGGVVSQYLEGGIVTSVYSAPMVDGDRWL